MSTNSIKSTKSAGTTASRERILSVATGGICLGLSFVLSQIHMFRMPQGGDITPASMLPILFFALCFGPAWGLGAAFIFSLLQLIGGYFMHPVQVLLDYTIAYTLIGMAGFFAAPKARRLAEKNPLMRLHLVPFWKIVLAVLSAFVARFICSLLSGVIFFAEYAGTQNVWIYSSVYNGSFLGAEAAITMVMLVGVSFALGLVRKKA
ncbi:MAG TPA: energy-coupled thiamine transporter ThiT [Bacillota bacterium]|nr:energy-coupled thiamine transporter ThiT [Bacillota bacterium]